MSIDSVRFVIHNYPNGSHFYVKRPGDGDNFIEVGYQNGAGRTSAGTWVTQPIAIPQDAPFLGVVTSPYANNQFWLSPYVITTNLDQYGNVHIDPRHGVVAPDGSPIGAPQGENNASRQPTQRAVFAPVAREVSAPARTPMKDPSIKGKFRSAGDAGDVIGDYRVFAVHNLPNGSRVFVLRSGDATWVDTGYGEDAGYRGGIWYTSPVLMPSDDFSIKVQFPDRTESVWRNVNIDRILQLFPALTDPVHIDATSVGPSPFWERTEHANARVDLDKTDLPKFGSISVHSAFKMRKVSIINAAGVTVDTVPAVDQNASLQYVLPDTYTVTAFLLDGRRQTISGVQVGLGETSVVELTADSIVDTSSTNASSKPPRSDSQHSDHTTSHAILIHGLEQGDRVSLSQPDSEVASAIAVADSDIHLENIPNGNYTLNVSFSNGNMANRRIALTSDSASSVTYDFSGSRGTSNSTEKSNTGWLVGGLVIAAGGALAWKYKDKLFAAK